MTDLMEAVADRAAGAALPSGRFWYERSVSSTRMDSSSCAGLDRDYRTRTLERWIALDGTQRVAGDDTGTAGDNGFSYDDTYLDEVLFIGTDAGGTYEELLTLPLDTESLSSYVEAVAVEMDGSRPVDVLMFALVRDLLREPLLPDGLRDAPGGVRLRPEVGCAVGRADPRPRRDRPVRERRRRVGSRRRHRHPPLTPVTT